jgi:hypothetical protein
MLTAPPGIITDWSPIYHFEPDNLAFAIPAQVRFPWYSTSDFTPKELAVYWSQDPGSSVLAALPDNYVNGGFNQASVRHLGWAIVGVPRAPDSICP